MCVGYVTRQVWSVNCWLFTFFTIFWLGELGVLDFAGQGCHCPIPTRGTPHFALFFGGARVVLLYLLYLLAGHAVWVRLCAEQICSWITWDWMETFLQRWHRSVNVFDHDIQMYLFAIELHGKPVTNDARTKKYLEDHKENHMGVKSY